MKRPEWNPQLIEAYKKVRAAANEYDDEFNAAVLEQSHDLPTAIIHASVRSLPEIRYLWEKYQLALEQYHWIQIELSRHNALTVAKPDWGDIAKNDVPKSPEDQTPAPEGSE